ncbi:hypothetical protein [Paenibacillus sp. GCM10027626]|uniref:hypothetical protein n=1 Tax=Paenibacillus sp. GCM10027626 TaxID=3273411 RepID=UPI00362F7541
MKNNPADNNAHPSPCVLHVDRALVPFLITAIDAAKKRGAELGVDVSKCYLECEELYSKEGNLYYLFWFYSNELEDWMEGFGDDFFDLAVEVDGTTGEVLRIYRSR